MIQGRDQDSVFKRRRALLELSQHEVFPYLTKVCGLEFEVRRGVFSPKYFNSVEVFCRKLPWRRGDRFLDMGTGCGVAAVMAALEGAEDVLAVDISSRAVANAHANVCRHGVESVVRVAQSDLFSQIKASEKFDTIYWNSPWIYQESWSALSMLERSVCDLGYGALKKFLEQSPARLEVGGRIILGFGSFGNVERLLTMITHAGLRWREVGREDGTDGEGTYILYEIDILR